MNKKIHCSFLPHYVITQKYSSGVCWITTVIKWQHGQADRLNYELGLDVWARRDKERGRERER